MSAQQNYDNQEHPSYYDNDDSLVTDCYGFNGTDQAFFLSREPQIESWLIDEGTSIEDMVKHESTHFIFESAREQLGINSEAYINEDKAEQLYKLAVNIMLEITEAAQ